MPTVAEIAAHLEDFAPRRLAADWDNVGLLLGDGSTPVQRVLTCLTVTPEVADEAVRTAVQLIVTHHPVLFRAVKRLTADTTEGRMLLTLIRAGISVCSPHSAFDNTVGGINHRLCERLGTGNLRPLKPGAAAKSCKVTVFVPDSDLSKVSDAMFAAGAGEIGQYRECSFRVAGTGTFFGNDATNPTVGQKGRREEANEWRVEVICPESAVDAVVAAMRKAHSYEEPAFDCYLLRAMGSSREGDGRVGDLTKPISLGELAAKVRSELKCGPVQVVGDPKRTVKRLAVACGAAGEYLSDAGRAKADVFLTGEMRFHDMLSAQQRGIGVIVPGHYATERFAVEELADRLGQQFADVRVTASQAETDPVGWV